MTVEEWLRSARSQIAQFCGQSAKLEAELLLCFTMSQDRVWLYSHGKELLGPYEHAANQLLIQRLNRVPLAQIIGYREFFGRKFRVNKDVLIPRQETEHIVEESLRVLSEVPSRVSVLDIGTGSGCIAITLKLELPRLELTALDISREALSVAESNADSHGARITFLQHDIFEKWTLGSYDCVVSNPPYVSQNSILDPEVAVHEPSTALFSGDDGLEHIRRLSELFHQMVNTGGFMIIEHGYDQKQCMIELFSEYKLTHIQDLAGLDRTCIINWK